MIEKHQHVGILCQRIWCLLFRSLGLWIFHLGSLWLFRLGSLWIFRLGILWIFRLGFGTGLRDLCRFLGFCRFGRFRRSHQKPLSMRVDGSLFPKDSVLDTGWNTGHLSSWVQGEGRLRCAGVHKNMISGFRIYIYIYNIYRVLVNRHQTEMSCFWIRNPHWDNSMQSWCRSLAGAKFAVIILAQTIGSDFHKRKGANNML